MKLFFKSFFFSFFLICPLLANDVEGKYTVKTKGIKIGALTWMISLSEQSYNTTIDLNSAGLLSKIYKFSGKYSSSGVIKNGIFFPKKYTQNWITKNKSKKIEIIFQKNKIYSLSQIPVEKEFSRINFNNLTNHTDPLTSFLKTIKTSKSSYTIDGRRVYLFFPEKKEHYTKINIKEFRNIWADHKRNDLEFLKVFNDKNEIFPNKIVIRFKGSDFVLIKN